MDRENRTMKEIEGIGLVLEFGINEKDITLTKKHMSEWMISRPATTEIQDLL